MAEPSSSRQRERNINRRGTEYLTHYARTVNAYPPKHEKQLILARLREIPGNEQCTLQKISSWFVRHRPPGDAPRRPAPNDEASLLFPTLNVYQLTRLHELCKNRRDPSHEMIDVWAQSLQTSHEEVLRFVRYQRAKEKEDADRATTLNSPEMPLHQLTNSPSVSPTVFELPRPHLPTPAKSPSTSPQTRVPSLPPIAVKVEEPKQCMSPLDTPSSLFSPRLARMIHPSDSRSLLEGNPPLSKPRKTSSISPTLLTSPVGRRDSTKALEASLRESLGQQQSTPTEPPPRSADEFAARFQGMEHMIQDFMNKYESGQLAVLGFDSSLSS